MGGDFSITELEHLPRPPQRVNLTTGDIVQSSIASEQATDFVILRIMVVVISFVVGVSLMNLFIGMLSVSYEAAHNVAHLTFMRGRARTVLDQHVVDVGI